MDLLQRVRRSCIVKQINRMPESLSILFSVIGLPRDSAIGRDVCSAYSAEFQFGCGTLLDVYGKASAPSKRVGQSTRQYAKNVIVLASLPLAKMGQGLSRGLLSRICLTSNILACFSFLGITQGWT
jgi:hypothetical protein